MIDRTGADDRRGDGRLVEQPSECDVAGALAPLVAKTLPRLDRRPVQFKGFGRAAAGAAARGAISGLADHSAEESPVEW